MPILMLLLILLAGCAGGTGPSQPSDVRGSAPGAATELVAKGRKQFLRCNGCHAVRPDEPGMTGPHLAGIVGRPSAAVDGFAYTDALRALAITWDEALLDQWLEAPQAQVPDMCMPFAGLPDADARRALIAFLKQPGS